MGEIESERAHKYRVYGAVYVILGFWIFFYFSLMGLGNLGFLKFWRFVSGDAWLVVVVLYYLVWYSSLVLVVLGAFLLSGDYVLVAEFSVVLSAFLLLGYFTVMFYPLFFLSY